MKNKHIRTAIITTIAVFFYSLVNAQHSDYREVVVNIPGLDSDKIFQVIDQLYKNTPGVEIMLRCKRGEMLVLKIDTRIHASADPLLRRISDNHFKATVLDGFDYNKAVATCSDYKPD